MTLKTSLDDGKTWPAARQIQYDSRIGAGYSDICQVDDDHVGVLYEGLKDAGYIFFLRLPVAEVLSVLSIDNRLLLQWPVNREATGIVWQVEVSADLNDWAEVNDVQTPGTYQDAVEIGPAGADRRFLRVKVTRKEVGM